MKKRIVLDRLVEFQIPMTPNFILDKDGATFSLAEFTDEELDQIAQEWSIALKRRARQMRENPIK